MIVSTENKYHEVKSMTEVELGRYGERSRINLEAKNKFCRPVVKHLGYKEKLLQMKLPTLKCRRSGGG